jgi:hypothetical protein
VFGRGPIDREVALPDDEPPLGLPRRRLDALAAGDPTVADPVEGASDEQSEEQ